MASCCCVSVLAGMLGHFCRRLPVFIWNSACFPEKLQHRFAIVIEVLQHTLCIVTCRFHVLNGNFMPFIVKNIIAQNSDFLRSIPKKIGISEMLIDQAPAELP